MFEKEETKQAVETTETAETVEKKEKKKMALWKKILIGVLAVIFLFVACVGGYAINLFNKINRFEPIETISPEQEDFEIEESDTNASEEEYPELDPDDVIWNSESETTEPNSTSAPSSGTSASTVTIPQDKDIINILLIGQDRREGQGRQRSDSMIIATLNKKTKTLKLTSLMRDMYVQIPGYSDNRINAAYAFGGMELLNKTIYKNFGLTIDGNIEVDFTGFTKIIDRIGGVEIALTQAEIDYLNLTDATAGQKYLMNGETALLYSRIRYLAGGDFKRTERQRKVLTAVFNKSLSMGLPGVLELIDELFPLLTTDLSALQLIDYATTVFSMDISTLQTYRLPVDGSYTQNKIRGMAVIVPNLYKNRVALKEIVEG